jgi:sporulation protein YlmC with PRC-barrel domain
MQKFTKYSIPVVLAGLVLSARAEDNQSQPSAAGAPATSQQSTASSQQSEQQRQAAELQREQQQQSAELQREQQERQIERQREQQQAATEQQKEQQKQATEQQRNQQSIFKPGAVSESQLKKQVTEVNKASSFIGMAVKNTENQDVGKVNDLVFDPQQGKISYAVLSIGGILGVGDKLVAIPITSLKPQPGQNYLVLNMQKSQLESAPGLAQNNWPDLDAPGLGGAAGSESGASSQSSESSSSTESSDNSATQGETKQSDQ